jgi:predicted outer membrane repeat protein
VANSTFTGNTAGTDGGALRTSDGAVGINNVTLAGNEATGGVGDGIAVEDAAGSAELSNTIVSGPADQCGGAGAFTSGGHNIGSDASCNLTGPGDKPNTDPKLGPLADNGGPTPTHALLKGSPAIGGGSPTISRAGGPGCEGDDQRGAPRKDCDIGAYERVLCQKIVVNLVGTSGKDRLTGTGKADGMLGSGGKDILSGKGGKDGLCGGPGKDKLKGGGGKDRLAGQGGKDTCIGQGGKDAAKACENEKSVP